MASAARNGPRRTRTAPLPTAADDHQRRNAESLVDKSAALMIVQKDLTGAGLRAAIEELRAQPEKLREMGRNIRAFHHPRAADVLVGEFIERIGQNAAR